MLLTKHMELCGPMNRGRWSNYGPLLGQKSRYHCHLKKGRPTYVACWEVISTESKIAEVYYVGTHENAPY